MRDWELERWLALAIGMGCIVFGVCFVTACVQTGDWQARIEWTGRLLMRSLSTFVAACVVAIAVVLVVRLWK